MDSNSTDWPDIMRRVEELWALPEVVRRERLQELAESDPETWRQVSKLIEADQSPPAFLRASGGLDFVLAVEESAPERVGPWRILGELGRGGMGRVYTGERADGRFERRVALKLLSSSFPSEVARRHFDDEVRLLARLEHPNIARLYDAGVDEGVPYLVMELVEGTRIDHYCDAEGLDATARVALFESVCEAVQHAHQNLVIHRDLKPSNILVDTDGVPKLLDFGIAKLEADAAATDGGGAGVSMTPAYASPEQRSGDPVAAASDVYSLGVTLFELVQGRRPPQDSADGADVTGWTDTAAPVESASMAYRGVPPRDRGDLDQVLAKALAVDPAERYPSVQAFLEDLRRFRGTRPVSVRTPTRAYHLERFVSRHRSAVAASVVLLALLAASISTALWQGRRAAAERDAAQREAARAEEVTAFLTGVFETTAPWSGGATDDVRARDLLDRGARRVQTDLAADPELQSEMMIVLGRVYQGLSVDDEAERLLEAAFQQRRARLGPDDPETIEAALAVAGFHSSRYSRLPEHVARSAELFEDAITRSRGDRGDARLLARALTGLGALHLIASPEAPIDASRSRALLDEGYDIAVALGDDLLVSDAAHYLGWWHANDGDSDRAGELYRTALDLRIRNRGPRSPAALSTAHQLGWFYQGIGRNDEAAEYFERTVDLRSAVYGPEHPRTASTQAGLAAARIGQGRPEEAEALLRSALGPMERSAADTTLASARGWLARALAGQGKMEEASAEFAWAVENGGEGSVARVVNDYAVHLAAMGRAEEAEEMYRRALEAYRAEAGPDHPFTGIVAGNLAAVISRQGRDEEAAVLLEEAIDILVRAYGPDHATVGNTLRDLGWARLRQGRPEEAHPHLDRAHAILSDAYGAEHWRTGVVKLYLGVGYRALERFDESEETLLESIRILEPHRAARPDDWYWAHMHIAALYTQLGRDAEADRFREAVAR